MGRKPKSSCLNKKGGYDLPYADLFEFAPVGYILLDPEGIIYGINKTGAALFGAAKRYMVNRSLSEWVAIDSKDDFDRAIQYICEKNKTCPCEIWLQPKNKDPFFAHLECYPVSDNDKVIQIRIAFHIIESSAYSTKPEQTNSIESSLLQSEKKFQTLADIAPIGIYITDQFGQCIYVNQRWTEMAGLTYDEALGNGWMRGLHPDDRHSIAAAWMKMIESEGKWGFEYRFKTKHGKTTWVYGLAAPYSDGAGNIAGYIGVNLDVTDRKQLEEVQEKYCFYLEDIIAKQNNEIDTAKKQLHETIIDQFKKDTALDVLLKKREKDKAEQEETMLQHLSQLIMPYLKQLQQSTLTKKQIAYIDIIMDNLINYKTKLLEKTSSHRLLMTPTEIRIANLIETGKTTKDIAELLNLSPRTIEFHRENIRNKVGLKNKRINLRSFLMSKE